MEGTETQSFNEHRQPVVGDERLECTDIPDSEGFETQNIYRTTNHIHVLKDISHCLLNMSKELDALKQSHYNTHGSRRDFGNWRLSPFTGKEDWSVWLARFETLARRYNCSDEDKLDQILPCIEGQAAQFVFSQLHPDILSNYRNLIAEMNSRYRVIETPRSYAVKFGRRVQKAGETVESFAADLKYLYHKAYGYRDRKTRDEDLLHKFLDGLWDDEISFTVEYHKEPRNIDEAVYYAVSMIQTRNLRGNRDGLRRVGDKQEDQYHHAQAPADKTDVIPEILKRLERLESKRPNCQDRRNTIQPGNYRESSNMDIVALNGDRPILVAERWSPKEYVGPATINTSAVDTCKAPADLKQVRDEYGVEVQGRDSVGNLVVLEQTVRNLSECDLVELQRTVVKNDGERDIVQSGVTVVNNDGERDIVQSGVTVVNNDGERDIVPSGMTAVNNNEYEPVQSCTTIINDVELEPVQSGMTAVIVEDHKQKRNHYFRRISQQINDGLKSFEHIEIIDTLPVKLPNRHEADEDILTFINNGIVKRRPRERWKPMI